MSSGADPAWTTGAELRRDVDHSIDLPVVWRELFHKPLGYPLEIAPLAKGGVAFRYAEGVVIRKGNARIILAAE